MRSPVTFPRLLVLLSGFSPGLALAAATTAPLLFEKPLTTVRGTPSAGAEVSAATIQTHATSLTQATEQLRLPLSEDVLVRRGRSYQLPSGATIWEGQAVPSKAQERSTGAAGGSVTLLRHGDRIYGKLNLLGQVFQVRPLADGTHRLIQYDPGQLPPDHPADDDAASALARAAAMPALAMSRTGTKDKPVFVRVMVNYTQAVLNAHPFINDFVDLLIAETNQGFVNSDVYIKLDLSAQQKVDYQESGDVKLDRTRYQNDNDRHMDEIHAARDAGHADLNVLLVSQNGEGASCGVAKINAVASTAFAVVNEICASTKYTFGHEIGHLFGALHDPATDSKKTPFAYGHGHQSERHGWSTIMAYSCKTTSCPRVNYWSHPGKFLGGNPSYPDSPMGDAEVSDNHRVLNERAAAVAAFRADSE